jgi:hypothetical protein
MYKKTCFVIVLTLAGEVQKFRWLIAVKKSFKRKNCHKKSPKIKKNLTIRPLADLLPKSHDFNEMFKLRTKAFLFFVHCLF